MVLVGAGVVPAVAGRSAGDVESEAAGAFWDVALCVVVVATTAVPPLPWAVCRTRREQDRRGDRWKGGLNRARLMR